jgi:Flp pilus assembly protein TadB
MKFPTLFTKIPKYKRFNYEPRWYDPKEEERNEREERIRQELKQQGEVETEKDIEELSDHHSRIAGSFKSARRTASRQADPSSSILRLILTTFLVIWLIAFLHFGNVAFYGLALLVPFYLFLKFRKNR